MLYKIEYSGQVWTIMTFSYDNYISEEVYVYIRTMTNMPTRMWQMTIMTMSTMTIA